MSAKERLQMKLDEIEGALLAQEHIENHANFKARLDAVTPYKLFLSDDDLDFIMCVEVAFERQMRWTPPSDSENNDVHLD